MIDGIENKQSVLLMDLLSLWGVCHYERLAAFGEDACRWAPICPGVAAAENGGMFRA
jgi:hypothetical protein